MYYNIIKIKIILIFIVLILYGGFVAASGNVASDMGFISLTIVNRPPVITELYFNPNVAFKDTKLECVAIVNDENVDETELIYKWYINNELIETSDNYLTGFNENDLVKCKVTPIDNEKVFGETKNISITINKKSTLSVITGFIVKNSRVNFFTIFNFLF